MNLSNKNLSEIDEPKTVFYESQTTKTTKQTFFNLSWNEHRKHILNAIFFSLITLSIFFLIDEKNLNNFSFYFFSIEGQNQAYFYYYFSSIKTPHQAYLLLFDISSFVFMFYFFKSFSYNKRKVLSILMILLFGITYFITLQNIYATIHFLTIWLITPFLLVYIANYYLIDIPYSIFLNMHTHTISNGDLFSTTKNQTQHHQKDEIYIDIFPQSENQDKEFIKIKMMYIRFIKFWYAQQNYLSKLRYFFPLLASIGGMVYFFCLLNFIQELKLDDSSNMALMGISLTILYFTMSHHINSFLHSKFYMSNILNELNKIYFDSHEYRHQLRLFFDKNFLVYIHDKNYDRHFCVNTSKYFQEFIAEEKFDGEGRNLIITVYISFFMIFFIETSVNILASSSPTSIDSKTTHIEQKNQGEKNGKQY